MDHPLQYVQLFLVCPVTKGIFQLQWPSILSDAAIRHPSQLSSPQPEKLRDVDLPEKEKFKALSVGLCSSWRM